jgi:ABC-type phosphate transport system substrate-binding protein
MAIAASLGSLIFASAAGATTLIGSGSSAAEPYMLKLFKRYSQLHHSIHFKYNADGGNAGVGHISQFAINTRPPLPSDSGTTYFKLFLDGLCVAVNKHNGLSNISLGQAKAVFTAVDTNWSQIPGSGLTTTIDPIGRNSAAGQYTFFQSAVLGGQTQASNVTQLNSDGQVETGIEKDPNSIGYVGLAHIGGIKPLTIGGVPCNDAHIKNESYPLFRYDWGVLPTKGASVAVEKFFDWVRTTAAAGKVIKSAGAVPAFNK